MFIEVNDGESSRVQATVQARGHGLDGRIVAIPVVEKINTAYVHDKTTLLALAEDCSCSRTKVAFRNIAGRRRIGLWLWK